MAFSSRLAVLVTLVALEPAPLTRRDLVIGPLRPGTAAAEVERALGRPDSIQVAHSEIGSCYEKRFYRGLTVALLGGEVYNFTLRDASRATVRGLRVGDSLSKAIALYGDPAQREPYWEYAAPEQDELRVMLTYEGTRITAVDLGEYVNCD
jgi:hypothetical protein